MKRILEVKKKIGTLSKNSANPFFKSKYLDLNSLLVHIEPLLIEQGLLLTQPILDGFVISRIIDTETGSTLLESSLALPNIQDPQKLGSCITYYRRYTLKSLLSIAEDDDDGNGASKGVTELPMLTKNDADLCLLAKVPIELVEKRYTLTPEQKAKYINSIK